MTDLMKDINKASDGLYDVYSVRIRYRGKILGGIPRSLEAALAMAEARLRKAEAPTDVIDKLKAEVSKRFDERTNDDEGVNEEAAAERSWTSFWDDEVGLYMESRTMKSALRECFSKLGTFQSKRGTKKTHDYGFFVEPPRLRFERDGEPLREPDGFQDRPITVSTAQGSRTSIKREDYVEGAEMAFTIKTLRSPAKDKGKAKDKIQGLITKPDMVRALALLQDAGHGASRSQGFGQLDIIACEVASAA